MKRISFIIFLILFFPFLQNAQENANKKFLLKFGWIEAPEIGLNPGFQNAYDSATPDLYGINLELEFPTKNPRINIVSGTVFLNSYKSTVTINGGGVFTGLSTKFGNEHIGANINFSAGIFSFKKITKHYDINFVETYIETRATNGLGAISSLGFYVKFGRFGLAPNAQIIYSGGTDLSMTIIGFNLPILIEL